MKTIKELQYQLNISSVSLYKMIKKPEFKTHIFEDRNNKTIIDETGIEMIKTYYAKAKDQTMQDLANEEINNSTESDIIKDENDNIIRFLSEQLKEKDIQINLLLNIISSQQRIEKSSL